MSDQGMERIEDKIAHLEKAVAELSDVAFRQQREIQALQAQVRALAERTQAEQAEDRMRAPEDERPPHY